MLKIISTSNREMGGAPGNPAPRNHFWCGLSNHQAATAQMHLVKKIYVYVYMYVYIYIYIYTHTHICYIYIYIEREREYLRVPAPLRSTFPLSLNNQP